MIEDIRRMRAHTLDAQSERMLAMLSDAAGTPRNVFEMFESVDMTFPNVIDENGDEAPLSHGTFSVYRESKSAAVRKDAFEKYFGQFRKYINTLTAAYAGSVSSIAMIPTCAAMRAHARRQLDGNNVPVSLYDNLVSSLESGLGTMKRYLEMRRKRWARASCTSTICMFR